MTEAKRAARRAAMPITTALLAEFSEFGARVIYARENGITVGKKPEYLEVFTVPAGYFPSKTIDPKGRK